MRKFLSIAILALILLPITGWSATYYVDNVSGSDSNPGTATDNAWQTVQKVNSSSFSAGDQVLFKRGQEWPAVSSTGYLDVPSSGSPGNPIVFGAYGTGEKPIISGMYPVVGGWTFATPNYWHSTVGVAVYELFWNTRTNRLARVYAIGDLGTGKFFYDGAANRVYVRDDPTGITTYASIGYYAMLVEDRANVTIQDIHFKNAYIGWRVLGTASVDNVILKDCEVSYNYTKGISIDGPNTDNVTIQNNTVYQNGSTGIYALAVAATDHLSNVTIDGNTVYTNAWGTNYTNETSYQYTGGIQVVKAPAASEVITGAIVQNNTVYSNGPASPAAQSQGTGIWMDGASAPVVRYNRIYSNGKSGLFMEVLHTGGLAYYNLIYSNGTTWVNPEPHAGIRVEGRTGGETSEGVEIYNNVSYGNNPGNILVRSQDNTNLSINGTLVKNNIFDAGSLYEGYFVQGGDNDGVKGAGNVYTYNSFGVEYTNFITWGAATPDTYDAWETEYGGTTSSAEGDPLFVSTTTPDFRLKAQSPAINAGTSVGLTADFVGHVFDDTVDVGAYEFLSRPILLEPLDLATDVGAMLPVHFSWQEVDFAIQYELQVDDNYDFSSPEVDVLTEETTYDTDESDGIKGGVKYFWRVRALR